MEQRYTFDQIAALYNAARPAYPQALCDDVAAAADLRPGHAILEVGCGTGIATRQFAPLGLRIVALDPGAELIRIARESSAQFTNVEFVASTFEALRPPPEPFRLVIAAQSWHWVAPEVRFAKAYDVLSPGGVLAVFGHVPVGLPSGLLDEFKWAHSRYAIPWGPRPEAAYLPSGPFKKWFGESGYFAAAAHKSYPWKASHTAQSYTDLMSTWSDFQLLDRETQNGLRAAIAQAIKAHGEPFDLEYETHLYMAKRLD
ncbi:MAG: class I SAM-dependent methyltransferase [Hyphomicrobiales bacterium]|nr:class I SAM-dependent methyltransferase [Hyphomicrobiales bacterium]